MAVRSTTKGEEARDAILAETPGADIEVRELDLADLSSVREFAAGVDQLDVLVNNAGVMTPPKRLETADGFELQFGSNFLGPFALTNLLLPKLLESTSPRVATMSSGAAAQNHIHFNDLQWQTTRYWAWGAYSQSKLGDMLMGLQLARISEERGWRLLSDIADPGFTRTNLQSSGANLTGGRKKPPTRTLLPSQDVSQGAEPLLFAAGDPSAEQGAYYGPGGALGLVGPTVTRRLPRSSRGGSLAASLWAVASDLTGVSLPQA